MANVLLTTYCNRNCRYCFARSKVNLENDHGDASRNMSFEDLEKIIAFYKSSLLDRFVILGGEPTLHPEFPRMIDRVLEEKTFESVVIFSNGLMPERALNYLENNKDPRLAVAMNLNCEADHTPAQWRQVNHTMKSLGRMIGLGINIFSPGQDPEYIINAISEYNLCSHVRVGLTHPIVGADNAYAREEDFPEIAEDLIVFAELAYRNGVNYSFDCGFPFCMFTLDQHRELLRFGIKFRSICNPIIDIGPDLSLWRCFPLLNDIAGHLDDFETRKAVLSHFDKKYKSFSTMGTLLECPECVYRRNQLCSGGCLARTYISFHR